MSDRAQSEVVGVILLVAVVALTISAAGAVYLSDLSTESGPATDVRVTVTDEAVTLTHNGGSALATESLRIVVRKNGIDKERDWGNGTLTGDGDDTFEPAEQWQRANFTFAPSDRIEVLLVHEPTRTLLVDVTANPSVD